MLHWHRKRAEVTRTAEKIYGGVVAAARQPAFYRDLGVADTPRGRFELVALHLFLALDPLSEDKPGADPALAQRTIERFVTDMDDCMREMGVGDLTVGKKVKRAAAAFYQRAQDYRSALGRPDNADLADRLAHYADIEGGAKRLARYVRSAAPSFADLCLNEDAESSVFAERLNDFWKDAS